MFQCLLDAAEAERQLQKKEDKRKRNREYARARRLRKKIAGQASTASAAHNGDRDSRDGSAVSDGSVSASSPSADFHLALHAAVANHENGAGANQQAASPAEAERVRAERALEQRRKKKREYARERRRRKKQEKLEQQRVSGPGALVPCFSWSLCPNYGRPPYKPSPLPSGPTPHSQQAAMQPSQQEPHPKEQERAHGVAAGGLAVPSHLGWASTPSPSGSPDTSILVSVATPIGGPLGEETPPQKSSFPKVHHYRQQHDLQGAMDAVAGEANH